MLYNGEEKEVITLDSPEKGVYINSLVWREMYDFSDDCVLMAIVDKVYDPKDYIFDINTVTKNAE